MQAVAWYRKAADQGNAAAQFALGVCCRDGVGIIQNHEDAYRWLLKGLFAERASDRFWAWAFRAGEGVEKDPVKTIAWLRKRAEQGRAKGRESTFRAQGRASAQYDLGQCYQYGAGVERDLVEAAAWYQKAAEQRIFNAAYELGVMYANGRGVPKDDAEAVGWYRFAAGQGSHAKAKYNLEVMYADGRAVPKDEDEDGWKHDDANIDF